MKIRRCQTASATRHKPTDKLVLPRGFPGKAGSRDKRVATRHTATVITHPQKTPGTRGNVTKNFFRSSSSAFASKAPLAAHAFWTSCSMLIM